MEIPPPKRSLAECDAILTAPGSLLELETREVNGYRQRFYKHLPPSLRALWLGVCVSQFADRPYLIYKDEPVLTYADVNRRALALAACLKERFAVVKGERVAVLTHNMPEFVVALWATALLGAVIVPLNAFLDARALAHLLRVSEAKVLIVDRERVSKVASAQSELSTLQHVLTVRTERPPSPMQRLEDVVREFDGSDLARLGQVDIQPDDACSIFCTSGTSALPKAVLASQRAFLCSIFHGIALARRAILRRGESVPDPDPNAPQSGTLLAVPLFHVTGCQSILMNCSVGGGRVVLFNRWNADEALSLIVKHRLTSAGGIGWMAGELVAAAERAGIKYDGLLSVGYGGSSASSALPRSVKQTFGNATATQVVHALTYAAYGLTETSAGCIGHSAEDYARLPASTGRATLVNDLKIVDERGREQPCGQIGELWIRGPNVVTGYLGDPKATAEAFVAEGWFRSGDSATMDDEGFVTIRGRIKELIIVKGENVSCVVVENVLYQDNRVLDAVAVSLPCPEWGERVGAVVVLKPGAKAEEHELIAHAAKHLPRYATPAVLVIQSEPLARNANGKIAAVARKRWEQARQARL